MNKIYLFLVFVSSLLFVSYSSNPPTGKTGAPGDGKCSDCHNGGTFTGNLSISNLPDTIIANKKYTISLNVNSKANKSGFEMLVLDGKNNSLGSFIANAEVGSRIDNGKNYAAHKNPKAFIAEKTSWTFDWTAPAKVTNDSLIFYYTSNLVNGTGNTTGDNPIFGKKKVILKSATNIYTDKSIAEIDFWSTQGKINFQNIPMECYMKIIDLDGRIEFDSRLNEGENFIQIPSKINGIKLIFIEGQDFKYCKKIFID